MVLGRRRFVRLLWIRLCPEGFADSHKIWRERSVHVIGCSNVIGSIAYDVMIFYGIRSGLFCSIVVDQVAP
jgi:hypothetical protein